METSEQIRSDLKALLAENHTSFELLSAYKGVPVICRAVLQKVVDQVAVFQVRTPEVAVLQNAKTTQILSDGLLEPIEATIVSFEPITGILGLSKFTNAGSRISNRKELRVIPGGQVSVSLECDQQSCIGQLVDVSMRGIGVQIASQNGCIFEQNKALEFGLSLPEGEVKMAGRIRNILLVKDQVRLSIEFTGTGPEKSRVVRYILLRRSEIYLELHEIFAAFEKTN